MATDTYTYVVDDDRDTLMSVEALLSQHGYSVSCFDSAQAFLRQVPLQEPGCLITDVQMPTMDGVELQKRLQGACSVLSVVVVTGVANVPLAVKMMEQGAIKLLEKPYDHIELLEAVERGITASRRKTQEIRQRDSVLKRVESLTSEEKEVLKHMLTDKPNKTIASAINKGLRTVDRRRQSVLDKMKVRSVPELATQLASAGIEIE